MGLFEEAGRRFEQFKRTATDAAGEEADYECAACGKSIYARRDRCPECGAEEIVSRDDADDADGPGNSDAADVADATDSDAPADATDSDDSSTSRGGGEG